MLGDLFAGFLEALFELLMEIAIRLPGYWILRVFRDASAVDPDGCLVVVVGLGFWVVLGLVIAASFMF